jgi:hypothetical protein
VFSAKVPQSGRSATLIRSPSARSWAQMLQSNDRSRLPTPPTRRRYKAGVFCGLKPAL